MDRKFTRRSYLQNGTHQPLQSPLSYEEACHAPFTSQFSKDILMTDPEFKDNDRGNRDPTIVWQRIIVTHILEREGPGIQKAIMATNHLLNQYTKSSTLLFVSSGLGIENNCSTGIQMHDNLWEMFHVPIDNHASASLSRNSRDQ